MRRPLIALLVVALLGALALAVTTGAGAAQPTATAAATTVKLKDSFFSPSRVTVSRGGQVRFVWAGRLAHNLVGPGVARKYATPKVKWSPVTVTFRRKGTFTFSCTLHPGMVAKVKVR